MASGRLMLDLAGCQITAQERELLSHPEVGGVILFSRNYQNPQQLTELTTEIRSLAPVALIAVDHEGGRVQRFRHGFTELPAMGKLATEYLKDTARACELAEQIGWLLAYELRQCGVDISFAPVLDLDRGRSQVIGDRAFGDNAEQVTALAAALIEGMSQAGMAATGKHFPGHGWAIADSHIAIPEDERSLEQIRAEDLKPFASLVDRGLAAVMPAHVIYSQVDANPAGFSQWWLQQQLRTELGFEGVIFSDDLSMAGASVAGGYPERAKAALEAGCDMVLVCNQPEHAAEVLNALENMATSRSDRAQKLLASPWVEDQQRAEQVRTLIEQVF